MPRDQYQTVREVADRLKVSEATVRGWIHDGALRAIEVGKGWRVADTDFEAFLQSHASRTRTDSDDNGESEGPAALGKAKR